MANYVHDENTSGKQPIVLARLPRVGAEQPMPVSPAASPTVPPPEVLPQLDLRNQIEQRTRLHIAATPVDGLASSTSHFVDRQHIDQQPASHSEPPPAVKQHQSPSPKLTQSQTTQPQASVAQPNSLGEKLFQLHAQLAPHAGLIVALALIASAGLLYWMIVGPAHAPLPNYQNPGYDMRPEGFGETTEYLPDFTANVEQPAEPVSTSPGEWTPMLLPAPPQVAAPVAPLAETTQTESALPPRELPPIGESTLDAFNFPTTSNPKNLDYSKLVTPPAKMARRPTESTNR